MEGGKGKGCYFDDYLFDAFISPFCSFRGRLGAKCQVTNRRLWKI